MTTLNEARGRIYQDFATAWGATSALTFDNEDFSPPAGLPWVRLAVRHESAQQESLGEPGARKFERLGRVFVQVFTPLDTGAATADNLASAARAVFEGKTLTPENIRFHAVTVREIGPDGAWYQVNVEAQFSYTETK